MLSIYKAEIIGFLCAEGSYYKHACSYWQYYKTRKKAYFKNNKFTIFIQFANFNSILLNKFQELLYIEYNYLPKVEKDRVRICKRAIITDLLKYSSYGCMNWKVPREIFSNLSLIPYFLRGYFEGDGTTSKSARFSSSNREGLMGVKLLLAKIGINSNFNGPYMRERRRPTYELYIPKKESQIFYDIVRPYTKNPKFYKKE